jgi:hypothetical protein
VQLQTQSLWHEEHSMVRINPDKIIMVFILHLFTGEESKKHAIGKMRVFEENDCTTANGICAFWGSFALRVCLVACGKGEVVNQPTPQAPKGYSRAKACKPFRGRRKT